MSSYKTLPTPGDTAWFTHDRFGMFIHFGLYAMPARHEWVKNYEEIPEDHYDLRPERMGKTGKSGRHEICRHDNKTS